MRTTKEMSRILWAVDTFEESNELQAHAVELVRGLAKVSGAQVEPVYVLSPDQLRLPGEFEANWTEYYKPLAERWLELKVKKAEIPTLEPAHIIVQPRSSLTASVRSLLAYAKVSGADAIVLGSHGRKGLPRLLMGSFAETLLLKAQTPIVVAGPSIKPVRKIERILFPSDFSRESLPVFQQLLGFAKQAGATVILHHAISNPVEPVLQSGAYLAGGGWIGFPDFFVNEGKRIRKMADSWAQKAKAAGVQTEVSVDPRPQGIVDSILTASRDRKADLIAMAAESGSVEAALIGSICRQVIRTAERPVWVLRTKEKKK